MLCEVAAHVAATDDDGEQAKVDQRGEGRLVGREQLVERGVELEDDDTVVGHELVEDVEGGDRGDVAGTEDQADPIGRGRGLRAEPRARTDLLRGHPGLDPHVRGETVQQEVLELVRGEGRDGHPTSGG